MTDPAALAALAALVLALAPAAVILALARRPAGRHERPARSWRELAALRGRRRP